MIQIILLGNRLSNYKTPFQSSSVLKRYRSSSSVLPAHTEYHDPEYTIAKPFNSIPGPSKMELMLAFLPGGKYHNKPLRQIQSMCREQYGQLLLFPGIFGKRNILISFNPMDYDKIFRTEGTIPTRRGLDTLTYYRKVLRKEVFKDMGGLVAEQGDKWAHFRTAVNPVMMHTTTVKEYIPKIDDVAKDFVKRIRDIRNIETNEMPSSFEDELNRWALESVGLVALDARLGLLTDNNPSAQRCIHSLKVFFRLMYELDFQPSLWKLYPTSKYRRLMAALDIMTETTGEYIGIAKAKLEQTRKGNCQQDKTESVLQKLLKIDPHIAHIMAMDLILAGVDTTSSGIVSCLQMLAQNPEKQQILRRELKSILPAQNTSLTGQAMSNLPYLRACIKESFRMCPVSIANFRTTGKNIVLSGYQVPKGTDIVMANMILMMDETIFPQPSEFIPERWLRNNSEDTRSALTANPFVFLPFGFGPRMCIGRRFAEVEIEILLARILQNFHVEWKYPQIQFKSNVINVPIGELKFKFTDLNE